jgi:hypothetical protein
MSYTYSGFYPDLFASYYDNSIFLSGDDFPYRDRNDYTLTREMNRMVSAGLYFPVNTISSSHGIQFTYIYEKAMKDIYDEFAMVSASDLTLGRVQAIYSYSCAQQFTYSVSPERGRNFFLMGDAYNRYLTSALDISDLASGRQGYQESDRNFYRVAGRCDEYLPGILNCHVTALLLRGAAYIDKPDDRRIDSFSLGQYTRGSSDSRTDIRKEWGIRGYPAGEIAGTRLAAGTLEYRLPLLQRDAAPGLFPVMFRSLWATAFVDYGNAWSGSASPGDFRTGAGIQLHGDFTLGYNLGLSSFIGYAHGFSRDGEDQYYFAVGTFWTGRIKKSGKRLDYL